MHAIVCAWSVFLLPRPLGVPVASWVMQHSTAPQCWLSSQSAQHSNLSTPVCAPYGCATVMSFGRHRLLAHTVTDSRLLHLQCSTWQGRHWTRLHRGRTVMITSTARGRTGGLKAVKKETRAGTCMGMRPSQENSSLLHQPGPISHSSTRQRVKKVITTSRSHICSHQV